MAEAYINHEIVRWALSRAALSEEELAQRLRIDLKKLYKWESGEERPSFSAAEKLAHALRIPFGYLFLSEPPKEDLEEDSGILDFRTVQARRLGQFSPELRDVIADALRKRDWYRDYVLDVGLNPPPFIGRYAGALEGLVDTGELAEEIATDMRNMLGLSSMEGRRRGTSWSDYINDIVDRAEAMGVLVLRNGIVGSNTKRPLSVDEFRGFAITDEIAPVVFINTRDAVAAQIFTLMHELAHLWIGASAVSDVSLRTSLNEIPNQIEQLCNLAAAEALVPRNELRQRWNLRRGFVENAQELARHFRVSAVVIARRAADCNLVERDEFFRFYEEERNRWAEEQERQRERREREEMRIGPKILVPRRHGRRFTRAVLEMAMEDRLTLRDAASLLSCTPQTVLRLAREFE